MKSFILAIILLFAIITTTVFISMYTEKRLVRFVVLIDEEISGDSDVVNQKIEEIEQEYNGIKTHLILFMPKSEVREIELHISDIKSAAESDDVPGVTEAKNRLMLHIEQLRRLSTFSVEAIF